MAISNVIDFPLAVNHRDGLRGALADFMGFVEGAAQAACCGGAEFSYLEVERELHERLSVLEVAANGEILAAARPDAERVEVDGVVYRRMADEAMGHYAGLHGIIDVERHLYRQEGVRNGPTIDPIALRCGLLEGRMTPAAAAAFGQLAEIAPWRHALEVCASFRVLPYSRSTLQRNGLRIGHVWDDDAFGGIVEQRLAEEFEIPAQAVVITVAADRVSIPMEEDRELTDQDRERGVERPITRVLRMAYCGVWTLHDKEGRPLHSVRYAGAPDRGSEALEASLREDLLVLTGARPDLRIVTLGDGAPEMQNILDRVTAGLTVEARLLDFWHLTEKLGEAAKAAGEPVKAKISEYKGQLRKSDDAIEKIEVEVRAWAAPYVDREEELPEGLHDALTYIENNRDRLRYATHRDAGLPIGSGHVEATCKTIVTVRCKRSGMRWRPCSAQSVLGLRALATSSRWRRGMQLLASQYVRQVVGLAA